MIFISFNALLDFTFFICADFIYFQVGFHTKDPGLFTSFAAVVLLRLCHLAQGPKSRLPDSSTNTVVCKLYLLPIV
jgi:hypothetical protein